MIKSLIFHLLIYDFSFNVFREDSGGGFSNFFAMPEYQKATVANYLQTNPALPHSSLYNSTGRSYPDGAAFATNFEVVTDLIPQPVDGTSCASPTFSAVLSLVNGELLNAGLKPLGFINPWLYSSEAISAFNPISQGSNPGCNSPGFTAQAPWSPVCGHGSPKYSAFLAAAKASGRK